MILWTEQGKLWHLPVDNEQGLEAEAAVGFHEHVFLERHLEPWCPQRGPLRHFMELVCVALGKNPWLSVEEKREHIVWFRDYFAEKQQLLAELKAM
ncbi:28S ribosomal protein S31, mitochondrial-like [Pollicipes pollicipes]|nr:28S ribosomal protein S31, mitochondrial-like [Pollicipes pollicipes]